MSTENNSRIVQIPFEEHMATSYLSYAKDVIEARALPSVSDGLKPVQRRILQSMNDLGLHPTTAYKKCARTVGDALGKYHPHGDASVYDAMVNLTQEFKERYPLIDGHGNFGSIDDDPAAAMRYTEARLAPIGELLLTDINKNTVDMVPNYDESEKEAVELPGLFPTLLANGSCGIAVGMSSSFVPHRAKDIYDMLDRVIDNTLNGVETPVDELIDILKAPDFPTGGVITNLNDVYRGYREGKGTVHIRSKYVIETDKKGQVSIVITEIPYRVVKTKMVQQIDDLRKTELSAEIKEVRDESNKDGIRVVIELKKGANEQFTINKLLKKTSMQSTISMNHQALIDGKVQEKLTLTQLVDSFLEHAIRVVRRKSQFELDKKSKRLHIVEGFIAISQDILGACETIIEASSDEEVIEQFAQQFGIDEEQTKSILGMKVSSLKKVSVEEYNKEQENLSNEISHLTAVVSDEFVLLQETKEKLHDIAVKFEKEERLSDISTEDILANITDRDLITKEDIVIMHTHNGLIKAVKINDYNAQRRSGKGISAKTQEDDFVENMITLTTRDDLVFLTNIGKAYVIPAYRIPIVSKQSIGKYVNNYVPTGEGEKVIGVLPIMHNEEAKEYSLFFSSKFGICKRLALDDLPSQKNGAKIVGIRPGDELVACSLVKETDKILLATKKGFAVKTAVSNIRVMGRASSGVIGIRFKTEDDYVISVMCANDEDSILVVSENGIGKQLKASDISTLANKGGKGSTYYKPTSKTGLVKAVLPVTTDNTIFIVTQQGMIIRVPAAGISTMGRTAAGVKMVTLSKDDSIASVSAAPEDKDDETEEVV